jgi:hypothetical protein
MRIHVEERKESVLIGSGETFRGLYCSHFNQHQADTQTNTF